MLKKLIAFYVSVATAIIVADTLKTNDGKTLEGVFQKYHKEKITFHTYENNGEQLEVDIAKIISLKFDKNTKGKATKTMSPKQPFDITLRSLEGGKFAVVMNGKREKVNARSFDKIEVPFNLQDFYTRKKTLEEQQQNAQQAELEPQKAEQLIVKDKATIIHFDDGSASSTRQGNLCRQLSEKSRGKLALIVVPIKDLNDPMATLNMLKTTPQFWFYSSTGKLIEKLADRFAEEDIEKAATKARKGK